MSDYVKMKKCPFCSYDDLEIGCDYNKVFVACNVCNIRGPSFEYNNKENDNFTVSDAKKMAIQRWNYRPLSIDQENETSEVITSYLDEKFGENINSEKFLIACDLISLAKKML